MAQEPLISVVVPCYNQAEYMDECLQSVLDQTYTNWECIIVNDGSPDHTEEIALKWTQKDPRFKYLKKENGGLSSARNAGIEVAKGEWILPLDSDDKIGDLYLELAEKQFNKNDIIYCNGRHFGRKNDQIKLPDYEFKSLLVRNQIFCTFFFQKKHYNVVNGYDENFRKGYEDWDFVIRLIYYNKISKILKLDGIYFFYRIKENSMLKDLEFLYKELRDNIYKKNKEIYDVYYSENYSYLIYKLYEMENQNKLYKSKLLKFYNNPLTKLYFKIQKFIS